MNDDNTGARLKRDVKKRLQTLRRQPEWPVSKRKEAGHYSGLLRTTLKFFIDDDCHQHNHNTPTCVPSQSPVLVTYTDGIICFPNAKFDTNLE
jgi:hypothetical protein